MAVTTVTTQNVTTTAKQSRIIGYDFARALAVLGMVIVNFKLVMHASNAGPKWLTWSVSLLEGRAAAMFVILAGIGLSLLSTRARHSDSNDQKRQTQVQILKRGLFLFVFGVLYSPIWPADILHFYGLYLSIAALLLYVPDRQLLWWAGGFIATFTVMILVFNYETGWDWDTLEYTDFWTFSGMLRHMFFNGFHPVFPWTAFVMIGMWLGRQDIRDLQFQQRLIMLCLVGLMIAEVSSAFLISVSTESLGAEDAAGLFSRDMIPPMPFYILSASSSAIIVIVLSVRFTEQFQQASWLQPFIFTGQLALSIYVAHVLIGMGLMEVFGWFDGQSLLISVIYASAFYVVAVILAYWWRQHFKRGPVEWIMRRITG